MFTITSDRMWPAVAEIPAITFESKDRAMPGPEVISVSPRAIAHACTRSRFLFVYNNVRIHGWFFHWSFISIVRNARFRPS